MITRHLQIKWLSGNAKTDTSGKLGLLTGLEGMDALIVLDKKSLSFKLIKDRLIAFEHN